MIDYVNREELWRTLDDTYAHEPNCRFGCLCPVGNGPGGSSLSGRKSKPSADPLPVGAPQHIRLAPNRWLEQVICFAKAKLKEFIGVKAWINVVQA